MGHLAQFIQRSQATESLFPVTATILNKTLPQNNQDLHEKIFNLATLAFFILSQVYLLTLAMDASLFAVRNIHRFSIAGGNLLKYGQLTKPKFSFITYSDIEDVKCYFKRFAAFAIPITILALGVFAADHFQLKSKLAAQREHLRSLTVDDLEKLEILDGLDNLKILNTKTVEFNERLISLQSTLSRKITSLNAELDKSDVLNSLQDLKRRVGRMDSDISSIRIRTPYRTHCS